MTILLVRRIIAAAVLALAMALSISSVATASPSLVAPSSSPPPSTAVVAGSAGNIAPEVKFQAKCMILRNCIVFSRAETATIANASTPIIISTIAFACGRVPGPGAFACAGAAGVMAVATKLIAEKAHSVNMCVAVGVFGVNIWGPNVNTCLE